MCKEFKLSEDEVEKLCEIAKEKCKTYNPADFDDIMEDWINVDALKTLVMK